MVVVGALASVRGAGRARSLLARRVARVLVALVVVVVAGTVVGVSAANAAVFPSIDAGADHSCAVRSDATLACWGDNDYGQASPPAGSFSSVSAGRLHTCAVRTNATVVCWGRFVVSPKTLRVSKTGRFTYRFLATPLSSGTIKLQSINKVKVGAKKRTIKLAAKQFTAPANAKAKVTFKLSKKHLNALKRARSVRFKVTVTLAGGTFTTKLRLRAPKKL